MTLGRRQNYIMTEALLIRSFTLDWQPNVFAIQNTTPYIIYVNIGTTSTPTKTNFTDIIAPNSSWVSDPAGAYEFAINIDAGGVTPKFSFPVNILFSMGAASVQSPLSLAFVSTSNLRVCQSSDLVGGVLTPNTGRTGNYTIFDYNQDGFIVTGGGGIKVPDSGIYQINHYIYTTEPMVAGAISIGTYVNGAYQSQAKIVTRVTANVFLSGLGIQKIDTANLNGGDLITTITYWFTNTATNLSIGTYIINITKLR